MGPPGSLPVRQAVRETPEFLAHPSLLEMMLESALSDIKEAPAGVLAGFTQQVLWLLRLLQDFLCSEGHGNQELWSEKVTAQRDVSLQACGLGG